MRAVMLLCVVTGGCTGEALSSGRDGGAAHVDAVGGERADVGAFDDAAVLAHDDAAFVAHDDAAFLANDALVFEDAAVPNDDAFVAPDAAEVPAIIDITGFGAATRGGWQAGADTFVVTSLADDGPGSLREACRKLDSPRVVTFAIDGRIALSSPIDIPSNISIDGRGHDVGVTGKGFWIHNRSEVILTHFAIEDVGPNSEDGIQIGFPNGADTHHVVIDHLLFRQQGTGGDSANVDEAISVIYGAHDITIAWSRFERWEKALLLGNGDVDGAIDGAISVTLHHNLFIETGRRHPRARWGRFDVHNNSLRDWHGYDWAWLEPIRDSYGAWCQSDCQMILEANRYTRTPNQKDLFMHANDALRCTEGGRAVWVGNVIAASNTAPLVFGDGCGANVFARPYAAAIDPADESLDTLLDRSAGN